MDYTGPDERDAGATFHRDVGDDAELATVVTKAVAALDESDPESLQPLLSDAVDPDALDRIFRPLDGSTHGRAGRVEFPLADYEITVWGDGTVVVAPD